MNFSLKAQSPPPEEGLFECIACELEAKGYVVLPSALPVEVSRSLLTYIDTLEGTAFHRAKTGRGADEAMNLFVRRDQITWMDEGQADTQLWFAWSDRLKKYLNRRLFLGLFSFESQVAVYEPGAFYKKHYDAFKGQSNRVLSIVAYLNASWQLGDGGELALFDRENETTELIRVAPVLDTLVLFLSEEFPHEVLPTQRTRYSVAGWFRVNASINDQIDPPR